MFLAKFRITSLRKSLKALKPPRNLLKKALRREIENTESLRRKIEKKISIKSIAV